MLPLQALNFLEKKELRWYMLCQPSFHSSGIKHTGLILPASLLLGIPALRGETVLKSKNLLSRDLGFAK